MYLSKTIDITYFFHHKVQKVQINLFQGNEKNNVCICVYIATYMRTSFGMKLFGPFGIWTLNAVKTNKFNELSGSE